MAKASNAAQILRDLRMRSGKTLREAADDLGVAASHLSRLERGEKSPSTELTSQIAHYYGTNHDLLALEQGRVPEDIVRILREHPELLAQLRREYGDAEVT